MTISPLNEDFRELSQYLAECNPSTIFILTDENTHNHCLPKVLPNLETAAPIEILEVEPGEEMKVIETAAQLWSILAEFEADRKALILNLGGGVITDLGGFVASTYKRGIRFINVPTTLLAMCDAAIGGKTGIDHGFLKNIVGTFAMAEQTFIDPDFLTTLPYTELRSGFAEMLKHGLIADKTHWQQLSALNELDAKELAPHIWTSAMIKQHTVEADFKEQNVRKTLNFGHTIGHAVESLFMSSGNPVPHGECVAMGMICEAKIAQINSLVTEKELAEVTDGIAKFFPKLDISILEDESIIQLMRNDKKNEGSTINFSLIKGIGRCIYDFKAPEASILEALSYYRTL